MNDIIAKWIPSESVQHVLQVLLAQGLTQAIELSMLEDGDITGLFSDNALCTCICKARDDSAKYKDGWATFSTMITSSSSSSSPTSCKAIPSVTPVKNFKEVTRKVCTKSVMASCSRFTARNLLGKKTKQAPLEVAKMSLASIEKERMIRAKSEVHKVFVKYAQTTPRFVRLQHAGALGLDLQMDTYRLKSKSSKVVARRARMAENFFLDLQALEWDILCIDEFMIGSWARGRVQGGGASAAGHTREVLLLICAATDVKTYVESPLVKSQLYKPLRDEVPEAAEQARELPIETVLELEKLVSTAPTSQMRCYCGFLALLASSSLRTTDCLRTRKLALTDDAITGVSQMKTKSTWTRWYADRGGFSGSCWATQWIEELSKHGLPGSDFVLLACSSSMDSWINRPAEYADVRRGLHIILMSQCGMSSSEAVSYNPHGFRHLLITIGQQLRTLGLVCEADIERLGHWEKDSQMVRRYDTSAGVSELSTRATLLRTVREGWRPAANGSLPMPLPMTPGAPVALKLIPQTPRPPSYVRVGHIAKRRVHRASDMQRVTVCGMWTCGSRASPAPQSLFDCVPDEWVDCRNCVRSVGMHLRPGDGKDAKCA